MISNLNPELSQRVVQALHNRLRQALSMDSAVPETAAAVSVSGPVSWNLARSSDTPI